jgi:hypothetical protein
MDKVALTHTHAAYHLTFASFQRLHLTLHPYVTSKQAHSFTAPSCLHPRLEHGAVDQRRRYNAPQFNLHPARPAFSPSSSLFPHTRRDKPDRPIPFLSTRNEKCTEAPSLPFPFSRRDRTISCTRTVHGCGGYQDREMGGHRYLDILATSLARPDMIQ